MTVTWTLEMAQRAGLANKGNWRTYPEAMLWARAVSQLCRMLFADCFAGGTYTAEELGDENEVPPALDDGKFPPEVELDAVELITDAQRTRLWAIKGSAGMEDEPFRTLVMEIAGVESTKLIPAVRYDALVAAVEVAGGSQFKIPDGADGA